MNIRSHVLVAAILFLGIGACGKGEKGQTAGHYIDDVAVTAKVKTAIASDVGVGAAANVSVETYEGTVQLSGFADSRDQADKAVAAAKTVSGVRTVKDDIRVKSP